MVVGLELSVKHVEGLCWFISAEMYVGSYAFYNGGFRCLLADSYR